MASSNSSHHHPYSPPTLRWSSLEAADLVESFSATVSVHSVKIQQAYQHLIQNASDAVVELRRRHHQNGGADSSSTGILTTLTRTVQRVAKLVFQNVRTHFEVAAAPMLSLCRGGDDEMEGEEAPARILGGGRPLVVTHLVATPLTPCAPAITSTLKTKKTSNKYQFSVMSERLSEAELHCVHRIVRHTLQLPLLELPPRVGEAWAVVQELLGTVLSTIVTSHQPPTAEAIVSLKRSLQVFSVTIGFATPSDNSGTVMVLLVTDRDVALPNRVKELLKLINNNNNDNHSGTATATASATSSIAALLSQFQQMFKVETVQNVDRVVSLRTSGGGHMSPPAVTPGGVGINRENLSHYDGSGDGCADEDIDDWMSNLEDLVNASTAAAAAAASSTVVADNMTRPDVVGGGAPLRKRSRHEGEEEEEEEECRPPPDVFVPADHRRNQRPHHHHHHRVSSAQRMGRSSSESLEDASQESQWVEFAGSDHDGDIEEDEASSGRGGGGAGKDKKIDAEVLPSSAPIDGRKEEEDIVSRPMLFQLSGSVRSQRKELREHIAALGGHVDERPNFNPAADMLIVIPGHVERTEKYLSFCAANKQMVSPAYIFDSRQLGQWLSLASQRRILEYEQNPLRLRWLQYVRGGAGGGAAASSDGGAPHPHSLRTAATTQVLQEVPFKNWTVLLLASSLVADGTVAILQAGGCSRILRIHNPLPREHWQQTNKKTSFDEGRPEGETRGMDERVVDDMLAAWLESVDWADVTHILVEGVMRPEGVFGWPLALRFLQRRLRSPDDILTSRYCLHEKVFSLELLHYLLCVCPLKPESGALEAQRERLPPCCFIANEEGESS